MQTSGYVNEKNIAQYEAGVRREITERGINYLIDNYDTNGANLLATSGGKRTTANDKRSRLVWNAVMAQASNPKSFDDAEPDMALIKQKDKTFRAMLLSIVMKTGSLELSVEDKAAFDDMEDPKEIMDTLGGLFGSKDLFAQHKAKTAFHAITLSKCSSMQQYIRDKTAAKVKFKRLGGKMEEIDFLSDLIGKVDEDAYKIERRQMMRQLTTDPAFKLPAIRSNLLDMARDHEEADDSQSSDDAGAKASATNSSREDMTKTLKDLTKATSALTAMTTTFGGRGRSWRNTRNNNRTSDFDGQCYNCQGYGHRQNECPSKRQQKGGGGGGGGGRGNAGGGGGGARGNDS